MHSYSHPVECWLQDNVLHVAAQQAGGAGADQADTWDLAHCKVVFKDKKLDRFKIVSLQPGARTATLKDLKVLADSPAEAQGWIRDILISQEVRKCQVSVHTFH